MINVSMVIYGFWYLIAAVTYSSLFVAFFSSQPSFFFSLHYIWKRSVVKPFVHPVTRDKVKKHNISSLPSFKYHFLTINLNQDSSHQIQQRNIHSNAVSPLLLLSPSTTPWCNLYSPSHELFKICTQPHHFLAFTFIAKIDVGKCFSCVTLITLLK